MSCCVSLKCYSTWYPPAIELMSACIVKRGIATSQGVWHSTRGAVPTTRRGTAFSYPQHGGITKAREITTSTDIASRDSKELIGRSNVSVNYVAKQERHANRKPTSITCHRCGGNNHRVELCKFINAVCYNCGEKGH